MDNLSYTKKISEIEITAFYCLLSFMSGIVIMGGFVLSLLVLEITFKTNIVDIECVPNEVYTTLQPTEK